MNEPAFTGNNLTRSIEYLSRPAAVSMSDGYFELASLDHFWVRRRFEVFRKLAGNLVDPAREMAEVGCGHGMLQRQVEVVWRRALTGFDLNEYGLRHNLSKFSPVCCYDIFQREPSLHGRFDLIFLWDVIEHIENEDAFIDAVLYHLSPSGRLIVNVPAGEWLFSAYDRAAGHYRRYSHKTLQAATDRCRLEISRWSYWGLPLLPAVLLRKIMLMGKQDLKEAYATGFGVSSDFVNRLMHIVANCEWIPQEIAGTSLMAVLQRRGG